MRFLVAIAMLIGTSSLGAQFPADVRAGARVRVWLPDSARQEQGPDRRQLLRGTVESVDGSTLRMRIPGAASSLAVPRSSVRRLDVSRGVSRGASMVVFAGSRPRDVEADFYGEAIRDLTRRGVQCVLDSEG